MNDPRYNSGSSLARTNKEEHIDYYEKALQADFTDEVFKDLKKLRMDTIKALHKALQERIGNTAKPKEE